VAIEFFGLGFGIFALTASYPYLIQEFGWSRTAVVASMTFVVTTVAVLGPVTGMLLDRYPIRRLFVVGSLVQAAGLVAFATVRTLPAYYAASVLLGVGMSGVTVLPNQVLVARWFRTRLGLVNGLITAGTVLGGSASPLLVTVLAERIGWRAGFCVLAALVGTVPPLVVWLLVRERPADLGLAPYGDAVVEPAATGTRAALGAALRQPVLWLLAAALFCASWPCYAATKHVILFLREMGVAPLPAAATLSWMLLAATVGRLVFGILWDHLPPRVVLVIDYVLLVAGAFLLLAARDPRARAVYVVLFGLGYGGLMPLVPLTVVAYFGRRGMGAVLGCFKLFYDGAAALAPLATAWLYDRQGSYQTAFTVNALLPCVALVLVLLAVRAPAEAPVAAAALE
jgi:MFS family permease